MLPSQPEQRNLVERVSDLSIVGRVETIELVNLELQLRCRIDTGARTSALHVLELDPEDDARWVTFLARGVREGRRALRRARVPVERWGPVRAANGLVETRAFVSLPVRLGGLTFSIEVGLTDREGMRYPMLLGRSAIAGRYLVDVSRQYVTRCSAGVDAP